MSMSHMEVVSGERASYAGFVDAAGGLATIVLAIIGLVGTAPDLMLSIVTIIFGAALLIQGGAMLSEYAQIIFPAGMAASSFDQFGGGSLSAIFLVGAGGIVLGVLALLGIHPAILTAIAVIAFGSALVLSSGSVSNLHSIKRRSSAAWSGQSVHAGSEVLAGEMASGSAGVQAIAGLAAIVLGILAVTGIGMAATTAAGAAATGAAVAGSSSAVLSLVALLILGVTLVVTGTTLSAMVMGFMRPTPESRAQA